MSVQYNQLVELGRDKKMIAAAEVGAAPLPDQLQAYQTNWLWFAVWGDTFINNQEWNSIETLKKVRPHVLRMGDAFVDLTDTDLHQRLRPDVGRDSGMARLRVFLVPFHRVEHVAARKAYINNATFPKVKSSRHCDLRPAKSYASPTSFTRRSL